MEEERETRSPVERKGLGLALAVGSAVVVLLVLGSLVALVLGPAAGMERGALWAVLLMILVTFLTVGGIGWGLYRAIGAAGEDRPGEDPTPDHRQERPGEREDGRRSRREDGEDRRGREADGPV